MDKNTYAIGLDVGGSSLKSAIVASDGTIVENRVKKTPINSQGHAGSIIDTFVQTLFFHLDAAQKLGIEIAGIGVGMPGPFDYENGICFIHPRQHKYSAIYGLNLKNAIMERLGRKKILFENDAWVFLRGEAWRGAAKEYERVIGLTLGTGLGSAFMVRREILTKGIGIPPEGWIGGMPYEQGIVEDKISARRIIARYNELSKKKHAINVEQVAIWKDIASIRIFTEIGERLGQVLVPIASQFQAQCIVIGGQISNAFSLFAKELVKNLASVASLQSVAPAMFVDISPIYGAANLIFQK